MITHIAPGRRKHPSFNRFGRRERTIQSAPVQKTRRIDRITNRAGARGTGRRPDPRSAVAAPSFEGFSRRRPVAGLAAGSCVRTAARRCHPLPYAKVTDPSSWSLFGRGTVAATVCMSMARGSRDCPTQHGRRSTHLEGSCERTLRRLARRRRPPMRQG